MSDIRNDFPFIVKHPEIAYFDNAATTLKPQCVIDTVVNYYENLGSNVHRGEFYLSHQTSEAYEGVRLKTAQFINAQKEEIIFTSGASESLNVIAKMAGEAFLNAGDVILLNETEHASNILPWYDLAQRHDFVIEFIPLSTDGKISMEAFKKALHSKVKLVSIAHMSNVLAYENDVQKMAKLVHEQGGLICVDGAQSIGHTSIDVKALDLDFFAFSAHKMLGPTGVGVLYGKYDLLDQIQPLKMGGGSNVRFNACGEVTYKLPPYKFESGTPNIEGVLGFGGALDYLNALGMAKVDQILKELHRYLLDGLKNMDHITVYNPDADASIVSLTVDGIFPQDVAAYLSLHNIAVRAGEHCAKLLTGALEQEKTVRVSLYIYNTFEEIDWLLHHLREITLEKVVDVYL